MSFSRRYAKNRANEPEQKSEQVQEPVVPRHVVQEQETIQESFDEQDSVTTRKVVDDHPSERKFSRLMRQPQPNQEAPLIRKPGLQASRLNQPPPTEEVVESPMPWREIFWGVLLLITIVAATITWHHRQQWIFPIKHIALTGEFDRVDATELQNVLQHHASGSLLFLSTVNLKNQLQTLPWVEQVTIHRAWPTTLQISIVQHQAVAQFGDHQLLNAEGILFTPPNLKAEDNLPYINGPDDRAAQLWQAYIALGKILAPYNLKITRLEVTPRLAYTLTLNNGIVLYLGANDVMNRLTIFTKVYARNLSSRANQIQYADMRYNSGMAVGWKE